MQRGDDSVGPRSWYWPTRYKLLLGLAIAVVVILFFVIVNPRNGSSGIPRPRSAPSIARTIEAMPIPPFNMYKLVDVRCTLSADHRHARCVGTARFSGDQQVGLPGTPLPKHPSRPGVGVDFIVRSGGVLIPACGHHDPQNVFCAS